MNEAKPLVELSKAVDMILESVGENTVREGLRETPARVANMYLDLTRGLRDPAPEMTTFDKGDNDQMVTIMGIDYWSMCEHHLIPFYGQVHIGYLPNDRIAGLSKFARITDWYAKRPQIQEQMTAQIAGHLMRQLEPKGVIVVVEGTHLCMAMRGVRKPNHVTMTSAIRGNIPKSEFLDLLKIHKGK